MTRLRRMTAYLLKFLFTYNKRGATPTRPMPGQAFCCKAFRASFTLTAAGYIGAGDSKGRGDLPLGQGHRSAQAIPQTDDLGLPGGELLLNQPMELHGAVAVMDIVKHRVIYAYNIHQLQGVSLLVGLNGIRQGYLALQLFLTAKIH